MATHEHIPRRGLLKGALVAPFAVGAFPALAATPDPLPGLWAACQTAEKAWLAVPETMDCDTPAEVTALSELRRLKDLMEETVASSPEGVAAQVEHLKASYGDGWTGASMNRTVEGVPLAFVDVILAGLRRIGQ